MHTLTGFDRVQLKRRGLMLPIRTNSEIKFETRANGVDT